MGGSRLVLIVSAAVMWSGILADIPDISMDPFIFQTDTLPENLRYLPSVGNGHLATIVDTDTVYVNGLYNARLGWSHRARVPAVHASNLTVSPAPTNTTYKLDIRNGQYQEEIVGTGYKLEYRVYAHQYYNRLLITEIKVSRTFNSSAPIVIDRESLTGDMSSMDIDFEAQTQYNGTPACVTNTCYYRWGQINVTETPTSERSTCYTYWRDFPSVLSLPAYQMVERWTMVFAIDQNKTIAEQHFVAGMEYVQSQKSQDLLDMHMAEWADIWQNGFIELEGSNLELKKVVYGCFYYLFSFLPAKNTSTPNNQFGGLSPGGLANGANWTDYQGHVFWDMETWMYPGILMFRPDLAREMLSYRIHGMDPSFDRATSGGYQGTRFPWESAFTGTEVTPDICPACREYQQHITGDIALAARHYLYATRDTEWLSQPQAPQYNEYNGLDFIYNMAKFWYTRPTWNFDKNQYEVNGVMPPDEAAVYVNNSVYTNAGAMLAINTAKYAACLAGKNDDIKYDVPDRWMNVAQNMVFMFDQDQRYHPEYEGFTYEIWPNGTVRPPMVKQADVVLLNFPYMLNMPNDVRKNDLEIYEKLTNPFGPAMTWGIFCIGWLQLDEPSSQLKAQELLNKSYQLYMREPFKIWTEAQSGLGAINFITGMGGFLQAILNGYGGLRLGVEDLSAFKPSLPEGITKMNFKNLNYLGSQLDIAISSSDVNITLMQKGPHDLTLEYGSTSILLKEGVPQTFSRQAYKIFAAKSSGCPKPDDYIKVDYNGPTPTTTRKPITCKSPVSTPSLLLLATIGILRILY